MSRTAMTRCTERYHRMHAEDSKLSAENWHWSMPGMDYSACPWRWSRAEWENRHWERAIPPLAHPNGFLANFL